MHRLPLAGLNSRHLVAKSLRVCLDPGKKLPYNWRDKLLNVTLSVCLARSVILQDIARIQGGLVKTAEERLSRFLSRTRLHLTPSHEAAAARALRRLGKRRLWRHHGKAVLITDSTSYAKKRSRGRLRPMPRTGRVRLHNLQSSETVLAPGYQELCVGVLLKDRTFFPLTRRLFTENAPWFTSQNSLEHYEIRRAVDLLRRTLKLDVLVVADRGFGRMELFDWLLQQPGTDFLVRLNGRLRVEAGGFKGLLDKLATHWPERLRMFWREGKRPIHSAVAARPVRVSRAGGALLEFNVLCLTPVRQAVEPMLLATSLPASTCTDLAALVRIYSSRWAVETFFFSFKESFRAGGFRVFSSWEAIDRLLAIAHIAFLALRLLFLVSQTKPWLARSFACQARRWFAGRTGLSFGRFLRLIQADSAFLSLRTRPFPAPV